MTLDEWDALPRAERYQLQARAHNAVAQAYKAGTLVRPPECSACGSTKKVEGHHDDYDKPLEVRWLCRKCHYHAHGQAAKHGKQIRENWAHHRALLARKAEQTRNAEKQ